MGRPHGYKGDERGYKGHHSHRDRWTGAKGDAKGHNAPNHYQGHRGVAVRQDREYHHWGQRKGGKRYSQHPPTSQHNQNQGEAPSPPPLAMSPAASRNMPPPVEECCETYMSARGSEVFDAENDYCGSDQHDDMHRNTEAPNYEAAHSSLSECCDDKQDPQERRHFTPPSSPQDAAYTSATPMSARSRSVEGRTPHNFPQFDERPHFAVMDERHRTPPLYHDDACCSRGYLSGYSSLGMELERTDDDCDDESCYSNIIQSSIVLTEDQLDVMLSSKVEPKSYLIKGDTRQRHLRHNAELSSPCSTPGYREGPHPHPHPHQRFAKYSARKPASYPAPNAEEDPQNPRLNPDAVAWSPESKADYVEMMGSCEDYNYCEDSFGDYHGMPDKEGMWSEEYGSVGYSCEEGYDANYRQY